MPSDIADLFFLKTGRKNFQIHFRVNEEDRRSYFGSSHLNADLVTVIRQQYRMGVPPKMYLYGQYGAGKSHTLYNLKYQLEESPEAKAEKGYSVRCRIIEAEFKEKTSYSYLHAQMMEAIGLDQVKIILQEYLSKNASSDLPQKLRAFFGDSNIAKAIQALGIAGDQLTLWKWLCGGQLSSAELNSYGLSKNMDTEAEMLKALKGMCQLFEEKRIRYLFMLDEMEGLQNVKGADAQESFHDAFRKLSGEDNDVVGFIISIFAGSEEQIPSFIFRTDIISRVGRPNVHYLQYLGEEADVKKFMLDLADLVIDPTKRKGAESEGKIPKGLHLYPFSDDALDQFVNYAITAPTSSLPRNIIKATNECAASAARRNSHLIEVQDLDAAQKTFEEMAE